MVEYALIVGGVSLIAVLVVSVLGDKTADLLGMLASVLPGANYVDEGFVVVGRIVGTINVNGDIVLDVTTVSDSTTSHIATSLGVSDDLLEALVGANQ